MSSDRIGAHPITATIYGSMDTSGVTVNAASTADTAASVTINTTVTATKWLVEVDADVAWSSLSSPATTTLKIKVDGSSQQTTGTYIPNRASDVGWYPIELTVRGRAVITLATVASHTIVAQVANGSGSNALTVNRAVLTLTQLTG